MVRFVDILSNEGRSVQDVADEFLIIFDKCNYEGTADFVELLFHAGGWSSFVYLGGHFPQKNQFMEIKILPDLYPPISNQENDFQNRFSEFIGIVLESSKCSLVYNDIFMTVVVRAHHMLSTGKWDMFRLIAQILGMKMLRSLNKEYEKLKSNYIAEISNALVIPRILQGNKYQGWQQSIFKIYHLVQFFVYKTLCEKCQGQGAVDIFASPFCRMTNLLNELMLSTSLPPTPMFKDRWLCLLLNGLRDKNYSHRGLCHTVVYLLLSRPKDLRWQRKLFNYIKSDLFNSLRMCNDFTTISLRIILSFAKYDYVILSPYEMDIIYFYLYHSDQSLAILASTIITLVKFKNKDDLSIIEYLLDIRDHSFIKCDELLIDSMYDHIKNSSWDSWIEMIKNAPDDKTIQDIMSLLTAFIRKSTTGFTPRLRTKIARRHKSTETNENLSKCTYYFIEKWFNLLEMSSVTEDEQSLSHLVKIPQFFDPNIVGSEKEILLNIAQVCLAYISLNPGDEVVEECCHTLSKIRSYSVDTDIFQEIGLIMGAATKIIFKDFRKFKLESPQQIISAAKYLELDDLLLWEVSMDKLNQLATQRGPNCILINTLIVLLFRLLLRRAECILEELKDINKWNMGMVNVLVSNCLSRSLSLQSAIRPFLHPVFYPDVRKTAFVTILELLVFTGPHLSLPEGISLSKPCFEDNDLYKLIGYTTELMDKSSSCQANHFNQAKLEDCCSALYKICMFITNGILDVHCFTPLMRFLGKNSVHDDIIMNAMNKFIIAYPQKWDHLSNAIFNTYIVLKEQYLPNNVQVQDNPEMMSKLFSELSILTHVLTRRLRSNDPRAIRKVSIRLHIGLIDQALKPSGFRHCIELLYATRELLSNEDVYFVLSCLEQYPIEQSVEVAKYYTFLKQSVAKPIFQQECLQILGHFK